jgi:4-hydroxyproline epimerase
MNTVRVVDSHTAGEPTRVVISGAPDLGPGSVAERLKIFRDRHDRFRSAIVNEPRGSDVLVGALLLEPLDTTCVAGVIFFNNVGCLGMCGHGTIGLIATLAHMGRILSGVHNIETPVGIVTATLHPDGSVSVANISSHRTARAATVHLAGSGHRPDRDADAAGTVTGDIAWGGNWFYLIDQASHQQSLALSNVESLTEYAWCVRQAVNLQGFPDVDHVELFGPPQTPGAHSRNFVLCPGKAYDRSPCGTGTSAKLACLAADGKLAEGEEWIQESIIGSTFRASYRRPQNARHEIIPTITGFAYVNAEATLLFNDKDPFCFGIGMGSQLSP